MCGGKPSPPAMPPMPEPVAPMEPEKPKRKVKGAREQTILTGGQEEMPTLGTTSLLGGASRL